MVEAEGFRPPLRLPIGARGLEHHIGAVDVGLDEITGTVDRAIYVGFCGQMHDGVGFVAVDRGLNGERIADVGLREGVVRRERHGGHVVQTGRVGQRVEVNNLVPAFDGKAHDGRSNKSGPAGDEKFHDAVHSNGELKSAKLWAFASLSLSVAPEVSLPQSTPISGSSKRTAPSHSGL